ncbi:MAG: RNA polymerase factor sigma-54 [Blastochloris sp.]|nr:RNA polymerase factor sigma-54 [Blastochloris sp.]
MQQSLHFLQAPLQELQALLQQEMQTNPVLEEKTQEQETDDDEWESEVEELRQQDEDWKEYFSQSNRSHGSSEEAQKKRDFLFESQIEQESLTDHLIGQLLLATSSEELAKAGEEIIGNLDEDGFLKASLEEIHIATGVPAEQIAAALQLVQSFHPPGIAARDLGETLLIQLQQRGRGDSLEAQIVSQDLDLLGRKRYAELARKYRVPPDRVMEAAAAIGQLQPRPGSAFAPQQNQNVVQAEASFIKSETEWQVLLNEEPVPRLKISDTYKDLLGQSLSDKNLKEYLRERIRAGKFMIKCLHQRQQTIENILKEIAKRQVDFLENGIGSLKPLTMSQVADAVGVHETTVSRAVANKYVHTPWGVLPMKFFFTSGYKTSEGETMSNTSIKDSINDLVSREDSSKPLSDSEIVDILEERGIKLARRTVAKYRAELNILPSNLRRSR